ncbi:uncharacterized protein LOC133301177 [Gastrolobium bilobum]|uniref:uncharacterized protein LOC133301177 n=1 Tax=Gastrolobium bilobum TaxID=150636 RepID=UPI002AB1D00D|nr:uncharacterized protein LOC133301177 [Gastrolobium bilobum]
MSETGSDYVLRSCVALLSRRDFTSCRELVHRVPRSDPNISAQVDQILAIVDVLGAAEHRLNKNQLNWYSILKLTPGDPANHRYLARLQFKTLVRLLDPNKNKFPFAEEAQMRVREAWFVLSDPVRRERHILDVRGGSGTSQQPVQCPSNGDALNQSEMSFWTMCPYCWYLHEYERKYEDCSLRCTNCKRTFHGVAVKPPAPETIVEGKDQYYCYHLSLPLRYPMGDHNFQGNGKKKMRIKTVANRVRMKGFIDPNSDSDLDAEENGDRVW